MNMHRDTHFTPTVILVGCAVAALAPFSAVRADNSGITVTPAVIDEHGLPNDMFNYTLTVTNNTGQLQNVFASVYELTSDGKQAFVDPAMSDRSALLADWISVSRGAMPFKPGETKKISVGVTINPYATAGEYHAVIAFVTGGTRDEAEQHLNGAPQVLVNFAVASTAKEILQLVSFGPERRFNSGFPIHISYAIKNTGDVPSSPAGELIFYDRIGHEVGSTPVNPDGKLIAPGETQAFTADYNGTSMGQYKVGLQATYGPQNAQLADTALFWVLPWQKLAAIFGIFFAGVILFAMFLHRRYLKHHRERRQLIERLVKKNETTNHVVDLRHPGHDH